MPYISESSKYFRKAISSVQGRLCADSNSEKSDPMFPSGWRTHASRRPSVLSLHSSGRHGNTFRRSSEFEKISALCKHELGRQLAPVRTTRQHRSDAEILGKEIAFIHSASVRTTWQHRPDAVLVMAITCRQRQSSRL